MTTEKVSYSYDIFWMVSFMIQSANERFIRFNQYQEEESYEDVEALQVDSYGRIAYDKFGNPRHEIIKFTTIKSKLSKAQIYCFNKLYTQDALSDELLEKILNDYARKHK